MEYNELLNNLESQRKQIVKRCYHAIVIIILPILIGYLIKEQIGAAIGGFTGIFISIIYNSGSITTYRRAFKDQMIPLIIAKTGMDLKYDYKDGVGEQTVMGSKLFKKCDRYHCEDLMYGEFDGIQFMTSDVRMDEKQVRHHDRRREVQYVPIFQGQWYVYDFNKEFNGVIQVHEGRFTSHPWNLKVGKIELEDVEFNKKFNTYATNEHDAFYVLTPSLMENIKKLERRLPGQIYFSFIGSMLHIAIMNSKDSFEAPIFSPINESFIDSQVEDINILQDIVNELKLNRKIFKD